MQVRAIILAAAFSAAAFTAASARDTAIEIRYVAPSVQDGATGPAPTPYEEEAVPYHPCRLALGWRDGHLVCDNTH
jgi:hypothetical protein